MSELYEKIINEQATTIQGLENEINDFKEFNKIRKMEGQRRQARKGRAKHFTKIFITYAEEEVFPKVTHTEGFILLRLSARLDYNTGYVVDTMRRPMTISDIQKIVNLSESQTKRVLKSLCDKGFIIKEKCGKLTYIKLDCNLFGRGELISVTGDPY